jgi:DNA-binding transcriptional ArsR family regulator
MAGLDALVVTTFYRRSAHDRVIDLAASQRPGLQEALHAAGDPMRQSLLELLRERPHSVRELAERLPISRPAVSQHLRVLSEARLVRASAQGTSRIYVLDTQTLAAVGAYFIELSGATLSDVDEGGIYHALAHPTRRLLLDRIAEHPGRTIAELATDVAASRFSVMKHLKLLERVRLVEARSDGRYRRHYVDTGRLRRPMPIEQARLELAYGSWLRRQRRLAESRQPLRSAQMTCELIGATTWAQQARAELRAAGERLSTNGPAARELLSAQELQIARLAADGLSNREIGERLFLSPRTVSSHLYRIFPKLGISSRGQLASRLNRHSG